MLFSKFVQEWEEKYAKRHLSPTTLDTYHRHLKNRIIPFFGEWKLDHIKTMHVLDYLNFLENEAKRKDGREGMLSSSTIEYNHRILSNIFKRAVEWQLIKSSPVDIVKKPKRIQMETSVYNNAEADYLLDCLKNEEIKWRVLIKLA
ncbi:site-specific integrase [Metabacillus bambusae]|uniref:Phage integrase N-terminal SAM-like domain-containing protein n=1 Tax=Metabacillus bambusae TaxID=2795218 RepID=A0ABS3NBL0_9BACI|nr:N-terminal phage integrase SAM-like domain-containing protein [Metabacillus bambusae]MBO1515672.1 phage integrase N-terminal SAM-like domain-containing protein [Metabacillus bambusae]